MSSGGQGVGVVTATGQHTEIGKISGMLSEVETLETPLTKQMNKFGKWLTGIILVAAVLLFLAGRFLHGSDLEALFQATIGFAVGAVPEGLPAILSITLARGVQRMAGRNAITRKLNWTGTTPVMASRSSAWSASSTRPDPRPSSPSRTAAGPGSASR